jgi:predicted nucleic acid-binding protein
MKVIVDTSVWSEYFRRKKPANSLHIEDLRTLIVEGRTVMLGIVKQELLSGVGHPNRFEKLKTILSGFQSTLATEEDHILAAEFFNACRSKGIQGSFGDFLICAQASRMSAPIITSDKDFTSYQKELPIQLWTR